MPQSSDIVYIDCVKDDEILYRSIWLREQCFFISDEGSLCISGEAFADKKKRPSVFRKHLCENPPLNNPPRLSIEDAVVSLTAEDIRKKASPISHRSGTNPLINHAIDVIPDTEPPNHISHAVVFANPEFPTTGAFVKLKNALALLAIDWAIRPNDEFIELIWQKYMS